jgi:pilus assembly protein CpaB
MGRRTLLLISSILIAAVGTALVAIYVRGADERAEQGTSLVTVLVARQNIPASTPVQEALEKQYFEQARVLKREKAADAYADARQLQSLANDGLVTLGPILAGQVIQQAMFNKAGAVSSTGLDKNEMRLAVQLNDPNRSAGFLQSEQKVAVFFTSGEGPSQQTRLLLPSVKVLSVGATTQPERVVQSGDASAGSTSATEDQVPTTIVSLAVSLDQAQKLIFSQKAGELYFAILQPNAAPPVPGTPTKLENL